MHCVELTAEQAEAQAACRASKTKFDEDAGFKTRSRQAVTALQGGDEESLAAWRRICEASRREFEQIYSRLGGARFQLACLLLSVQLR